MKLTFETVEMLDRRKLRWENGNLRRVYGCFVLSTLAKLLGFTQTVNCRLVSNPLFLKLGRCVLMAQVVHCQLVGAQLWQPLGPVYQELECSDQCPSISTMYRNLTSAFTCVEKP